MKVKRRELLKLLPVIVGGPILLKADGIEKVEETKEPDCYVGLLAKLGFFGKPKEIEGRGYTRVAVKWKFITSKGVFTLRNEEDVAFPVAEAAWGTIEQFAFFSKPEGGELLKVGPIVKHWFIDAGDTVSFLAGDLDIVLD